MSEPIPESIPTSASSRPPRKKPRVESDPISTQARSLTALFADPTRPITLPSAPQAKTLAPPPELVANVQGSSAGAGSGEFHVYKASRRREYERLRLMDEEARKEKEEKEFEETREKKKREDEEKTRRNREKRSKRKKGKKGGKENSEPEGTKEGEDGRGKVKRLGPGPAFVVRGKEDEELDREEREGMEGGEVRDPEEGGIIIKEDE